MSDSDENVALHELKVKPNALKPVRSAGKVTSRPSYSSEAKVKRMKTDTVVSVESDSFDIIVPNSLLGLNGGGCTVLLQIDTQDASALDFSGAVGVVGRLETDEQGGMSRLSHRVFVLVYMTQYILSHITASQLFWT
jgi:hypothetical protein